MNGMHMPIFESSSGHLQHKPKAKASSTAKAGGNHGMDMSTMQGVSAPFAARSSDYSDGYGYGPMPGMEMPDNPVIAMLLLDRLEYVHARDGGNGVAIDGEAWYGKNFNKLWLKFEGEHADGQLQDLRAEALWSHAIATYWNTQLGVRHDFGVGPERTWAAFGIEGLAPWWFQTEATLYVGPSGRTAARVSVEYEGRLTQRLILQPELEANAYGKNDPRRGIGSGLSDARAGLRLRYEIRREFAPYVGVEWLQRFAQTADFARAQGQSAGDLRWVVGFRIWY
ncbi:MAG: copper resistance protein B [Nevskiaceae bacterium]|nr:MAG: copper resistance protein B [Nevskiaceae bacterium]TBR72086.1 MAG: copper resistance protein B [Nevskiaceae bacterium]